MPVKRKVELKKFSLTSKDLKYKAMKKEQELKTVEDGIIIP